MGQIRRSVSISKAAGMLHGFSLRAGSMEMCTKFLSCPRRGFTCNHTFIAGQI